MPFTKNDVTKSENGEWGMGLGNGTGEWDWEWGMERKNGESTFNLQNKPYFQSELCRQHALYFHKVRYNKPVRILTSCHERGITKNSESP